MPSSDNIYVRRIMSLRRFLNQDWLAILILVVLVTAIAVPIYSYRILSPVDGDYGSHIMLTIQFMKKEFIARDLTNPGLQLLLYFIFWLFHKVSVSLWTLLIVEQVCAQVATALIIFFWIGRLQGRWGEWWRVLAAVSLTIVAPIALYIPLDGRFYYGYIGLANYHNPTIHLLRPLALASFILVLRAFEHPTNATWKVVLSAFLIIAASLVKPSYGLSVFPAVIILAALYLWQKKKFEKRMLIGGLVIPGGLILAAQSVIVLFFSGTNTEGIVIQPFAVEKAFSHYLLAKFFLSILFPLIILILNFRSSLKNPSSQLAWIAFIAGASQMYFLAEEGNNFYYGNFRWSAQIALFLLFVASLRFFLQKVLMIGKFNFKKDLLPILIYLLNIAFGILYYVHCMTSPHYG
jgi:hypothetical protein